MVEVIREPYSKFILRIRLYTDSIGLSIMTRPIYTFNSEY